MSDQSNFEMPRPEAPKPTPKVEQPPAPKPIDKKSGELAGRIKNDLGQNNNPDETLREIVGSGEGGQAGSVRAEGMQAKNTAETPDSPKGMDADPRYKDIQDELRQEWLQKHPGEDFLTENGQNYSLGYMDPKQKGPTLKSDTDRVFRERYAEDAKAYDEKEKTRVYEDSSKDPAVRQVEEDILRLTNSDSQVRAANTVSGVDSYSKVWHRTNVREGIHAWNSFIDKYPDKAKAYAKSNPEIKRALEGREKKARAAEKIQQPFNADLPKNQTPDGINSQPVDVSTEQEDSSSSAEQTASERSQYIKQMQEEYLKNLVEIEKYSNLPQSGIITDESGSSEVPTIAAESSREARDRLEAIGARLRDLGEELPTEEQARVVMLKGELRTDPDGNVLNNDFNRGILAQIANLEGKKSTG